MMDVIALVWIYLLSSKHKAIRRKNWRRKQSVKRRKAFAKRQSEERVLFMLMLKMSCLVPPSKQFGPQNVAVNCGEHVVNTTFTPHDWFQIYLNGKNFHLRGYQEHATQIRHFTNPDRYVYYKYGSKNHPGGIADPTEGKFVPIMAMNTSRCHGTILNFYFSNSVYMKPMPFTPTGIKLWFWDENFPKTKLSTLLKTMMKEANISGNFTNHSLRVTGTTMLFDSGAIIQKHTGHRSLSALQMYERVTPQQQAMASNILANTPS